MNESLVVDVNHDGMHTLGVPSEFTTPGSFDVRLQNHGEATHVHLKLDDDLSTNATLEEGHHYVEKGDTQVVRVTVADGATGRGVLEVTTAHGGTTEEVSVELGAAPEKPPVEIDESLADPATRTEERPLDTDEVLTAELVPALALGGVAILLAASTLLTGGTVAIVLGVLAAVSALGAAAYVYSNRSAV
ncbi:DUF7524 family protein [Halomarina oriensis]|uniref:Uncharacterized protein n=1 Tax=Halomarina oriensis TaxID=671145 RepID=A0A6B0GYM6_9EURY|nr:hypothetical protein [Halomarina oriensis]MWG36848.1 hypothetical protein [Halomarina oriensis]